MRNAIHRSKVLAALLAVALLVAACGGDDNGGGGGGGGGGSGNEEMPTVKLSGFSTGLTSIALTAIKENGFDEANGFKGEYFFLAPDASGQFFLQRKSDIAFDTDPIVVATARAQGVNVTSFYPVLTSNPCLIVKSDSGYESPEDLAGKKVGHFGAESGTTTILVIMLQELYGVNFFEDYNLVESDPATLVELLDRGDVEGILDFVPHTSRAIVQAGAECLFGPASQEWEEATGEPHFLATMAAYEDYLKENPDLAEKVTAAWDDALNWLEENPEALQEDPYAELMGQDDPEVLKLISEQVNDFPLFTNDWSEGARQAAEDFVDLAAEQGTLIEENPGGIVSTIEDWEQ